MTDLEIYHNEILKLAALNRSSKEIDNYDKSFVLKNPMCGDQVDVKILINNSAISQISAKVKGCALCEASAGLVTKVFRSKKLPHDNFFLEFTNWLKNKETLMSSKVPKELEIFYPIKSVKNRHKCIIMPFEASFKILKELNYLK